MKVKSLALRLARSFGDTGRGAASTLEFAPFAWVAWFSRRSLHGPIGDVPPIECEQAYYRQRETHTSAVTPTNCLRKSRRFKMLVALVWTL